MPEVGADATVLRMIREDVAAFRAEVNARLDRLVTTESLASEMRRIDDRFTAISREVTSNHVNRERAMSAEQHAREVEDAEITARLDKTALLVRWALASVVIPVVALVLSFVLIIQGGGEP